QDAGQADHREAAASGRGVPEVDRREDARTLGAPGDKHPERAECGRGQQRPPPGGSEELDASRMGLVVEAAVRTAVARDRLEKVVRTWLGSILRLLSVEAGTTEVMVTQPRGELVAGDCDRRRTPDPDLPAPVSLGGPRD